MNKLVLILLTITISCNSQDVSDNNVLDSSIITKNSIIIHKDSIKDTIHIVPKFAQRLIDSYEDVIDYKDNYILFSDKSKMIYDDRITKNISERINKPDIEDQFTYQYSRGELKSPIVENCDPGRIRNEEFFKKIYGANAQQVKMNLVEITWCPILVNQKILITKVNGVADKVKLISAELDKLPQFKKYIQNIGGTFNWRNIAGTNRLSMHSFGMTMDINTQFSNYWQWDCKCSDETKKLKYKNQIPQEIIDIFEKYGFIWGGKWYHYDTMHFEYRPELLDM